MNNESGITNYESRNLKQTAIKASESAGKILLDHFKKLKKNEVKSKDEHEIVTTMDLKAEKEIIRIIKSRYPEHSILSEEKGGQSKNSDYLWIVDPLDGTTNYSIRNPFYNVSIAVAYKKEIVLGVVFAPSMEEFYIAEKGKGAYLNGKKIHASEKNNIRKSLITYCHGHRVPDIKRAIKIYQKYKLDGQDAKQLGASALELGFVAAGRTDTLIVPGAHSWDVAAGVLLVREAGGKATDFQGKEWNLKSKDMVASNKKIHLQLIKFLKNI